MKLQIVGCSHHTAPLEVRERLAFRPEQVPVALTRWRDRFPQSEAVLLSTCNRVEVFVANEQPMGSPTHHEIVDFLADFHGLNAVEIFDWLFKRRRCHPAFVQRRRQPGQHGRRRTSDPITSEARV